MAEAKPADTVPNLGFKDKDKALDTLKALEGRDPDYQKLAIKGLVGRANRVLSITKAEDKLTNIKDALKVFDDWLKNFEKLNLSKGNMAYLPLATVQVFAPLQAHYGIDNSKFIEAYTTKAEGDYKKLRTIESAEGDPTWDIIRNTNLKQLKKELDAEEEVAYWDDDGLPTKIHAKLILWAYSPEAAKIKKTLGSLEEKVQKLTANGKSSGKEDKKAEATPEKKSTAKTLKRKSEPTSDSSDEDESPEKKTRTSSEESD